jgi:hypothetical protein
MALLVAFVSQADAEAEAGSLLSFQCEWRHSDPPYSLRFEIDIARRTAIRTDSDVDYIVLEAGRNAIWLAANDLRLGSSFLGIDTIERSAVGGVWNQTVLDSKGDASASEGGYCVEVTN